MSNQDDGFSWCILTCYHNFGSLHTWSIGRTVAEGPRKSNKVSTEKDSTALHQLMMQEDKNLLQKKRLLHILDIQDAICRRSLHIRYEERQIDADIFYLLSENTALLHFRKRLDQNGLALFSFLPARLLVRDDRSCNNKRMICRQDRWPMKLKPEEIASMTEISKQTTCH